MLSLIVNTNASVN